ncbi:hypothetical protein SFRURICE_006806 [Spodoptera frugiperda]|nr:hypothetical protein SFRURICE_006806 [Spodoptera frugiperda]
MPRSSCNDSDVSPRRKTKRRSSGSRRHRRNSRSRTRHNSRSRSRRNSRSRSRRNSRSRTRRNSRSRSRCNSRSRSRRDSYSRSRRDSVSRSRSRSRRESKSSSRLRSRHGSRSRVTRSRSREGTVGQTLAAIRSRLDAIEGSVASTSHTPPLAEHSTSQRCNSDVPSAADTLADALNAVINRVKPHNYYVSNFDPAVHNFETWCSEVERAKLTNNWGDSECLSRVAHCLKGDARTWLNEWVTSDRSWSNFIKEFRSLCPHKLDYANILFEVMNTNSNKFNTYAEYARRSLLRLRIVKGLSEELMVQIVIRGINDAQVRAAAANADLTIDNLVTFLAIYTKPSFNKPDNRASSKSNLFNKRNNAPPGSSCYLCAGQLDSGTDGAPTDVNSNVAFARSSMSLKVK